MVCNVAPSGSSRSAVTVLRVFMVSGSEEVESAGVTVNEIASAPGVRRGMMEVEETCPMSGGVRFIAVRLFFPPDLRTHLDMT